MDSTGAGQWKSSLIADHKQCRGGWTKSYLHALAHHKTINKPNLLRAVLKTVMLVTHYLLIILLQNLFDIL